MSLIDDILSRENLNRAFKRVKANKGCAGIDNMPVSELKEYIMENRELIIKSIREKKYKPQPVKRVYIPKADGKQRPLGIPTAIDRVIQQAVVQRFSIIYEPIFIEYSYGFRPNRDCHKALAVEKINNGTTEKALNYLYLGDNVIGLIFNDSYYHFQKNLQNDIIAIYNESGTKVAAYEYDAWGNHTITLDTNSIGSLNPFRYRGYYYDEETQLFYCNSR